jgi:mRNA-degrading endonuclease toxin of MazEF toxin-antitoxin module
MQKDFDRWNNLKKKIQDKQNVSCFREREICFISLGINIGYEQDGKHNKFERPIIVFQKLNKNLFLGLPLTNTVKENRFYFNFEFKNKTRGIILSQIRLLDAKRIQRKIGNMSKLDFQNLNKKLKKLLFKKK